MTSTALATAAPTAANWPPSQVGPPLLLSVVPNSGPAAGGNLVQLNGQNLRNVISVTFGGVPAQIVSQSSSGGGGWDGDWGGGWGGGGWPGGGWPGNPTNDIVVVIAPPHAPGSVQVLVTTTVGTSNSQVYTYVAPTPPTAVSITPTAGPTTGGTLYLITGTNLTGVTSVTFGGSPSAILTINPGGTSLIGITPAGPPAGGNVAVTLSGPGGTATVPGGFTYFVAPPAPAPVTITPNTGPHTGLTPFTITGTNLGGVLAVLFNGVPATGVTATPTAVSGITPAGAVGTATVTLVTAFGTVTVPGGFIYT
ncbi:cell wall protein [Streptomyces violaceusniger]|uniref:IPT/TIG domain-containing protein n=2 Tax=Streptomyces violaceusniger group TaxID=2839105 RepID=A0ABD5JRE3_9ACTN|nr:IPT/TIG domain-containing protein [Streptomyces violaceusniger]KUL46697.1 cell wall protein [Streptomyces violaceusniger]MEE4589674.1 IPT/TIG domain-containing protein [Streptomyces sp. DSM 41602]